MCVLDGEDIICEKTNSYRDYSIGEWQEKEAEKKKSLKVIENGNFYNEKMEMMLINMTG